MQKHLVFALVATIACTTTLGAQNASRDTVDKVVANQMAQAHIPGIAIAVVRAGKVIKAEGYGFADLEHNVRVTPQTVFKIGSVSKQFLATGIMLLAQDGKLSVDDPVSRHIPGTPASWS